MHSAESDRWFYRRRLVQGTFAVVVAGSGVASRERVREKYLVYILKTVNDPTKYYTGLTSDLDARLEKHNAGGCPSTAASRPWEVDVVIEFKDERRAAALERYLKSGSGCAFASRHLR